MNFNARHRLPLIRQSEATECGLACLAMIANFHGHNTNLSALRLRFSVSMKGSTLSSLMASASYLDLSTRALSVDLKSLDQLKLPAILHWEFNHFVVLESVSGDRYCIHDPARGIQRLTREQVSEVFTGVALELTPTGTFTPSDDRLRMKITDLWSRVVGLKRTLIQTLILSVLVQLFVLAAPFYMQLVVDEVLTKYDAELLLVLALGFGLFMIIRETSGAIRSFQILYLSSLLDFQIVSNLARHLFRLPLSWFEKRHVGDILSRFGSTQAIRELFAEGIVAAFIDGVMAISTLALMIVYSPKLAFIVIVAVVGYVLLRLALYRPLRERTEDGIVARANEQSALIESVRGIQSIKVYGRESERLSAWQNRFAEVINASVRLSRLRIAFRTSNGLLFGIENTLVIYFGALDVIAGGLSVGMLFAFMAYKRHLVENAVALAERAIEWRILGLHLDRISDIALAENEMNQFSSVVGSNRGGLPQDDKTILEISNLSFRYGDHDPYIIEGVSLKLERNEFLTIVGPSGCGKSTLMKLILGLFDPIEGDIKYKGTSIQRYARDEYRRKFGTVMQNDMLLSGSIAENISFFDPDPDIEKTQECAINAYIHEDICAMPMGYNSLVGDMGSALSAGQKQRILLARALYAEPEFLVLDEGTANLDPATEECIVKMLSDLKVTRICVAHRDKIIMASDRVLLLNDRKLRAI